MTFVAYFLFGGWKLFTRPAAAPVEMAQSDQAGARADDDVVDVEPFERQALADARRCSSRWWSS